MKAIVNMIFLILAEYGAWGVAQQLCLLLIPFTASGFKAAMMKLFIFFALLSLGANVGVGITKIIDILTKITKGEK